MTVTICLDFDGVLHSYKSGWTGLDNIADDPVPGAKETCEKLIELGYNLVILSTRFNEDHNKSDFTSNSSTGKRAAKDWLKKHGFPEMKLVTTKPPASLYVDDRAFRFNGDFRDLMDFIHENPIPSTWAKTWRNG